MTGNSKSSPGPTNTTEGAADPDGFEQTGEAPTGTDQWAQAVVDGMPAADAAGGTEDDDVVDAEIIDAEIVGDDAIPESWFADGDEDSGSVDGAEPSDAEEPAAGAISVEDLVLDLERVTTERDQYLDASRRLQAEFENYKKQVGKREAEARERANDSLVGELLPVLDAFDGAVANGAEDVAPMRSSFLDALAKHGLERIDPIDDAFDPNLHEAVMHEDADNVEGPVVAEVMRAGYVWKGRVLRPAMVRTRG